MKKWNIAKYKNLFSRTKKWVNKCQRLVIFKMKDVNCTVVNDVDINNILVSNKMLSGELNYKYFICYL